MCNLESDPGGLLAGHLRPHKTPAYRLSARTNASQRVIRLESLGYNLALSAKRFLEVKENTGPPHIPTCRLFSKASKETKTETTFLYLRIGTDEDKPLDAGSNCPRLDLDLRGECSVDGTFIGDLEQPRSLFGCQVASQVNVPLNSIEHFVFSFAVDTVRSVYFRVPQIDCNLIEEPAFPPSIHSEGDRSERQVLLELRPPARAAHDCGRVLVRARGRALRLPALRGRRILRRAAQARHLHALRPTPTGPRARASLKGRSAIR